jgi:hypothetical protein
MMMAQNMDQSAMRLCSDIAVSASEGALVFTAV